MCFYPIFCKSGEIVGFGDICEDDFHPPKNIVRPDGIIEVYPIDNDGVERKWVLGWDTVKENAHQLFTKIDEKDGSVRIYRAKDEINYKSIWTDSKYSAKKYGTELLGHILPITRDLEPLYPKSIFLVEDCLHAGLNNKNGITIDYFAGSGTTGHAIINLNRTDDGFRKYILVEMGEYFNSVTKPRIQKVIYSEDWRDGKPVSRNGSSHCFKYMRLESYEDTLNNLQLHRTDQQQELLTQEHFGEEYLLHYMLDVESRDSLLNLDTFKRPFGYKLKVTENHELAEQEVDLVETFNYLIGLAVKSVEIIRGNVVVQGSNLQGEKILVIWRAVEETDNQALNEFFRKLNINTRDSEFKRIYVNGDNNLENIRMDDEQWKVVLIEEEFHKRMFDTNDV